MILGLILPFIGCIIWLAGLSFLATILPDYVHATVMLPYIIPILVFEGISVMPKKL